MHFKKGKVVFGYKDTYNICVVLSPVISAGLVRFKGVLLDRKEHFGVPYEIMKEAVDLGLVLERDISVEDVDVSNSVFDTCRELWVDYLDKMIYAFEDKVPDTSKYNFSYVEGTTPSGVVDGHLLQKYSVEVTDQDELDRYRADCEEHNELVSEGLILFGRFYKDLQW